MPRDSIDSMPTDATAAQFSTAGDRPELPAWSEIEEGRYMPRRVRGSYHGRALG